MTVVDICDSLRERQNSGQNTALSVQTVCTLSSDSLHSQFRQSALSVQRVCTLSSDSLHSQFRQSALSVQTVCTLSSDSLHSQFRQSALSSHLLPVQRLIDLIPHCIGTLSLCLPPSCMGSRARTASITHVP